MSASTISPDRTDLLTEHLEHRLALLPSDPAGADGELPVDGQVGDAASEERPVSASMSDSAARMITLFRAAHEKEVAWWTKVMRDPTGTAYSRPPAMEFVHFHICWHLVAEAMASQSGAGEALVGGDEALVREFQDCSRESAERLEGWVTPGRRRLAPKQFRTHQAAALRKAPPLTEAEKAALAARLAEWRERTAA